MLSLFTRFVIVVSIVISVTDAIVFYHITRDQVQITVPFVVSVIIITIIPIAINLWYWLVFKQKSKKYFHKTRS